MSYLLLALLTFTIGVALSLPVRAFKARRLQDQLRREATLRVRLLEIRDTIDQCHAELGIPLRSLRELVDSGCLREIPLDPITEKREWEEMVTDSNDQFDSAMLVDIHSTSRDESSDGSRYDEW